MSGLEQRLTLDYHAKWKELTCRVNEAHEERDALVKEWAHALCPARVGDIVPIPEDVYPYVGAMRVSTICIQRGRRGWNGLSWSVIGYPQKPDGSESSQLLSYDIPMETEVVA